MPLNTTTVHSLSRVFQQAFVVYDIAEPLVSFDDTKPAEIVREFMESNLLRVVGVREEGRVSGYANYNELNGGKCGDHIKRFSDDQVVSDSQPLKELIIRLDKVQPVFITAFGSVGGIATRSDLQKPPVRMWLFGIVTLIEMRLGHLIEQFCPQQEWPQYLSEARLEKAQQLLQERERRNQELNLLDCLQLSDKGQIIARNTQLRDKTRFESRNQFEKAIKMIERLRNNLAHAQDIIASDWEAIVALAENVENVLDGPPGMKE